MLEQLPSMASLGAGMRMLWLRQEIIANNLANVSTTGFKQDDLVPVPGPALRGVVPPGPQVGVPSPDIDALIQWTDYSPGPLQETGRSLDVALSGAGFLEIETPRGLRYTRAGALIVNTQGVLAAADGSPVLGTGGPIAITSDRVQISERGEVSVQGQVVGAVRLVDFPEPYRLTKEGDGRFAPADRDVVPKETTDSQVLQGFLEGSNVNPVGAMVRMIEVLRTYEAHQRAVQAVDEIDRQATNDVGRVT